MHLLSKIIQQVDWGGKAEIKEKCCLDKYWEWKGHATVLHEEKWRNVDWIKNLLLFPEVPTTCQSCLPFTSSSPHNSCPWKYQESHFTDVYIEA